MSRAPRVKAADGAAPEGGDLLADTAAIEAVDEPATLHADVAAAARAAQAAGNHVAHAALTGIENLLGELRARCAAASEVLCEEHAPLLERINATI